MNPLPKQPHNNIMYHAKLANNIFDIKKTDGDSTHLRDKYFLDGYRTFYSLFDAYDYLAEESEKIIGRLKIEIEKNNPYKDL